MFSITEISYKREAEICPPALLLKRFGAFSLNLSREQQTVNACLAFSAGHDSPPLETELAEILHQNELRYFRQLKSSRRRQQYFLGRQVGKEALSLYLNDSDRSGIEISSGVFHQPLVRYYSIDTPALTLSHSADFAVAIAHEAGHIMGVDVEQLDDSKNHIFQSSLTEREKSLAVIPAYEQNLVCNVMWTIKEALSKAIKCGMTIPFEILEIGELKLESDGSLVSYFKHFGQYKVCSWILPGFALSIALPKKTRLQLDLRRFCH